MNDLGFHVTTTGNEIYKSNVFSWLATYDNFASRGVSVSEEEVIYKCIFIHEFSQHLQLELIWLLTFQEKLLQISYRFLWLESEAVMVDNLWVPESTQTFSQAVPLLQPASQTPAAETPGQAMVTKCPLITVYFAAVLLVSSASCESRFQSDRLTQYSLC